MTARKPMDPRERAARALCRHDGHPPDIMFEGKPMWMSYLDQVDVVLDAVGWRVDQTENLTSGRP